MCFYFFIFSVINYMYHIASLFIYKYIMFNTTIVVVRQPSGYMGLAFHWQYMSNFHLLFFTYYIVLSMENKYTIPYHTI